VSDNDEDSKATNRSPEQSRVDLTTTLYGELRKLAKVRMSGQYGGQTIQATALVHEAWLRLGGDEQPKWNNRAHYYAAVAEAMRHILVDRARRRQRIRHGGGLKRIDMDAWNWENLEVRKAASHDAILILVHESLEKFTRIDPQTANLVKLHYFAGLTIHEVAESLELSERTSRRRLAYARAWLDREIRRNSAA